MSKESVMKKIAEEIFRTVANPQLRNQIIRRGIDAVYPVADQILKIKGILVEAEDQSLPDKVWIKFKSNPEFSMPAQKEICETAIMVYKQSQQDMLKIQVLPDGTKVTFRRVEL